MAVDAKDFRVSICYPGHLRYYILEPGTPFIDFQFLEH